MSAFLNSNYFQSFVVIIPIAFSVSSQTSEMGAFCENS